MAAVSAITADRVFDGSAMRCGVAVVITDGIIRDLVARQSLPASVPLRDLGAGILAPGFVDLQVNGGGGALFNAKPTLAGVQQIARSHRACGTTMLLPTVITDSHDVMTAAVAAVAQARAAGVPGVAGIHLEGPFIDPARKGAHPAEHVRPSTGADINWLVELAASGRCGVVFVTLAPNVVPPDAIRRLAGAGIIVSLGHSDATAEQTAAALAAGALAFTHLFNAMSQVEHRAPGMAGVALTHSTAYASLIADGHHVDPLVARLSVAAIGAKRLLLISDAMPTAAGGPDSFLLQGREVRRAGSRLTLPDGTLAGATITMADAVAYTHRVLGVDAVATLTMATATPARLIRRDAEFGRIVTGARADFVHLSDGLALMGSIPFADEAV